MKSIFYLPILKSKQGEFAALSKLNLDSKKMIVPLFEVTPLEWDQTERKIPRSLNDHLKSFCKKFNMWGNNNCFIDVGLLNFNNIDNTNMIEDLYEMLFELNYFPIPVVRIDSTKLFNNALIIVLKKGAFKEIAIRVNPADVTSEDFELKITSILKRLKISVRQAHIIFDLKDSNFSEVENFSDSIVAILEEFPMLKLWKSFTIAGTAFPPSNQIKEGVSEFKRNDWGFYKMLLTKLKATKYYRSINYGDYSIVSPEYFEFNPKIMKSSAVIKYTHNEKWIVAKGNALKNSADYLQYRKLAKDIYKSKYYMGENFSQGDLHLSKCANGEGTPGAPSTWNWVGNNHHFTKVISDLLAIPPVS